MNSQKEIIQFKAHNSAVAALKLSQDGSIVCTASNKGTLIRIFSTKDGSQLHEVRRGADQAVITDICIDPSNEFVSCASDKGTIHVFKIAVGENKKSKLSMMGGISNYFGSEWSFC